MKGRNTRTEGLLPSDSQDSGSGSMAALTDWVLSHKRLVLGLWLVIWVAAVAAVGPAGSSLSQQFNVPGREGFETNKELAEIYGAGGDVAPIVPVVTLPRGRQSIRRACARSSMRRWRRWRRHCRSRSVPRLPRPATGRSSPTMVAPPSRSSTSRPRGVSTQGWRRPVRRRPRSMASPSADPRSR